MLNTSANLLFHVCVSQLTELDDPDSGTLHMQMDLLEMQKRLWLYWWGHLGKCPAPKCHWENSHVSTLTLNTLKGLQCKVLDLGHRPKTTSNNNKLLLVIFGLHRSGLRKRKLKTMFSLCYEEAQRNKTKSEKVILQTKYLFFNNCIEFHTH